METLLPPLSTGGWLLDYEVPWYEHGDPCRLQWGNDVFLPALLIEYLSSVHYPWLLANRSLQHAAIPCPRTTKKRIWLGVNAWLNFLKALCLSFLAEARARATSWSLHLPSSPRPAISSKRREVSIGCKQRPVASSYCFYLVATVRANQWRAHKLHMSMKDTMLENNSRTSCLLGSTVSYSPGPNLQPTVLY